MNPIRHLVTTVVFTILPAWLPAQNLVFHNTLGSEAEATASVVGPNLLPYGGGAIGVAGPPLFTSGVDGAAITVGAGSYGSGTRVHVYELPSLPTVIDPEEGTIEVVFRMTAVPVAFQYGIYRLFDGGFGLSAGIGLDIVNFAGTGRLRFFQNYADGSTVEADSLTDGLFGHDVSSRLHRWHHAAAVWDRAGIDGSADTMRLYFDGQLVAATQDASWGTAVGARAGICGGNDGGISRKCHVDDVKVWDAARVAFDLPDFRLDLFDNGGVGSLAVARSFGTPTRGLLTVFSVAPANAGAGLGTGWLAGLHVGIFDVVTQWGAQVRPFVATLDAFGGDADAYGPSTIFGLSGVTVYAVALEYLQSTTAVLATSAPVGYTFP